MSWMRRWPGSSAVGEADRRRADQVGEAFCTRQHRRRRRWPVWRGGSTRRAGRRSPPPPPGSPAGCWLDDAGVQWDPEPTSPSARNATQDLAPAEADRPALLAPAIGMDRVEVAATDYPYRGRPPRTRVPVWPMRHDVTAFGADLRAHITAPSRPPRPRRRGRAGVQLLVHLDRYADRHHHRGRGDRRPVTGSAPTSRNCSTGQHGAAPCHLPSGDPGQHRGRRQLLLTARSCRPPRHNATRSFTHPGHG